jgi:phenylpropionate dioxygenase-like ring-hydroxylating dioxygenase large terminal subunit
MTVSTHYAPRNCWYVAGTSDEVGQELLGRRLLDTPVVLYRRGDGEVVAMEDRCVHRAYPLSDGRLEGDRVVCGYHGFTYDPDGRCVAVPSQENVPGGACVRTFAVQEREPFVWIWLGAPGAAALSAPPRIPWLGDEGWVMAGETLHVDANFLLLHEHYLDLTNVFVMHPEAVPPGIEQLPALDEVEVSELSVSYARTLPSARLADWEAEATGLSRESEYGRTEEGVFVSPALHVQRYVIEAGDGEAHALLRVQGFTPESATETHVFLQIARDYAADRAVVTGHLGEVFHEMAQRDAAVLETVQRRLAEDRVPRRDINVKADRAALRARRVVQAMVEEESADGGVTRALRLASGRS